MTASSSRFSTYQWNTSHSTHEWLDDAVVRLCARLPGDSMIDIGCGNGALLRRIAASRSRVAGCDPEELAVDMARASVPNGLFKQLSVYDDPTELGLESYDLAISTEVVEHLYLPRYLPRFANALLRPGGLFLVTTPYYGYVKNLVLALTNRWDDHHTVMWDGGHIKFWSRRTLTQLLTEGGFQVVEFHTVGRRSAKLWPNNMMMLARKVSTPA